MRRKKKLLLNLLKILVVIAIVVSIYFLFFKKKKNISTTNTTNQTGRTIELVPITESNEEVKLPENIYSASNNETSNKTYQPATESPERYLVSILANNEVTILIGNDSEKILPQGSPIQIGSEYTVSGIETELKTVYYFNITGYDYPIFLLLSQDGKISYVDIEESYHTGNFVVKGTIKNIPEIKEIYETTVEEDGETSRTAILVGTDNQGYEFKLSMIGK